MWLSVWNNMQIVCIWSSWCHCLPKTSSSLASFKSRQVLRFLYWLTQVFLEKRLLNGCSSNFILAVRPGHSNRIFLSPVPGLWSHCLVVTQSLLPGILSALTSNVSQLTDLTIMADFLVWLYLLLCGCCNCLCSKTQQSWYTQSMSVFVVQ